MFKQLLTTIMKTTRHFVLLGLCSSIFVTAAFGYLAPAGKITWPDKKYDRVVGYQYANPWGVGGCIEGKDLKIDDLAKLKSKEAVLNAAQVERLLQSTFQSKNLSPGAVCYDPHQIFVFYSGDTPIAAIDICFHCAGSRAWPEKATHETINYPELAKLCVSLGLGSGPPDNSNAILTKYRQDIDASANAKKP